MANRYDVLFVHEYTNAKTGQSGSSWYKCGQAFQSDNGNITVRIATLPAQTDAEGMYKFVLREPQSNGPRNQGDSGGIPF